MTTMNLMAFIVTGLTVAILHAALPTHWLPFVLAARAQKWTYQKTVAILLIAGSGHILTTTVLGALIVWFGLRLHENFESLLILVSSVGVMLYGSYNIYQHYRGIKHSHCDHAHPHHHDFKISSHDGWAILSLLTLLTFSPCESFIPVYVSAWTAGWAGFMVLTAVLAAGTLLAMITFTTLAFYGFKQFKMDWLEDHEKLIIGCLLILLSIVIYFSEHSH